MTIEPFNNYTKKSDFNVITINLKYEMGILVCFIDRLYISESNRARNSRFNTVSFILCFNSINYLYWFLWPHLMIYRNPHFLPLAYFSGVLDQLVQSSFKLMYMLFYIFARHLQYLFQACIFFLFFCATIYLAWCLKSYILLWVLVFIYCLVYSTFLRNQMCISIKLWFYSLIVVLEIYKRNFAIDNKEFSWVNEYVHCHMNSVLIICDATKIWITRKTLFRCHKQS